MIVRFFYPDGKKKALTFSYDDGTIHDRRLVEIFNRYGMKATFNLNSLRFDSEGIITTSEIPDLYRGHEVAAHTYTHPFLERVSDAEIMFEVLEDRKRIEQASGQLVRGMAYPFGTYNQYLVDTLPAYGIRYSRTVACTHSFGIPDNCLKWNPSFHHSENILSRWEDFVKTKQDLALFYIYGHSFEFDKNNNWELIEKFCEKASGNPEVWYATNIEIYDYLSALKRVEMSVDKKIVMNPSATDIWLAVDTRPVRLAAGSTIYL